MPPVPAQQARIRERPLPGLNAAGIAVQHFPEYRNQPPRNHGPIAHDICYLSYLVRGRARHRIADDEHQEAPGALAVIHYGVAHEILTEGTIEVWNLYLDPLRHPLPDLPGDIAGSIAELIPPAPGLHHRRNRLRQVQFASGDTLVPYLTAIHAEQEAQAPGWTGALRHHLALLLIATARRLAEVGYRATPALDDGMEQLRQELDRSPVQPHSLAELAQQAGCSREHLCRRFKRHTGVSVVAYLQQRRIESALRRLAASREPVLDIALACGFGDLSHFNRVFRRLVGCAPRQWRQRRTGRLVGDGRQAGPLSGRGPT